jgi:hypothetical protein
MMVILYNVKTGAAVEVDGVDAREYLKTGGWSASLPEPEPESVIFKKVRKTKVKDKAKS